MQHMNYLLLCMVVLLWGLILSPQQHTTPRARFSYQQSPPASSTAGGGSFLTGCRPPFILQPSSTPNLTAESPLKGPLAVSPTPPASMLVGGSSSKPHPHPIMQQVELQVRGGSLTNPPTSTNLLHGWLTPPAAPSAGGA